MKIKIQRLHYLQSGDIFDEYIARREAGSKELWNRSAVRDYLLHKSLVLMEPLRGSNSYDGMVHDKMDHTAERFHQC